MKSTLLILLSLIVSSVCFGRVTFKVNYFESSTYTRISIWRFDTASKQVELANHFSLEKDEGATTYDGYIKNSPKNVKSLIEYYSYLDEHGLCDHQAQYQKGLDRSLKLKPAAMDGEIEECFFMNGYRLDSFHKNDKDLERKHHIYFFSKD